jgi:hypothetical protein
MPSVLRFPATQERDPTDLPESQELFEPPPDLVAGPKGTKPIRRSSPTIIPDVSFSDEPTRPSHHPEVDEAPWGETTAPSAPLAEHDFFDDEPVDPSAETAALPTMEPNAPADAVADEVPPRPSAALLLAASGVMVLLAATAVMLVVAMLQRPEPAAPTVTAPNVAAMVAPAQALPAPTISVPEPVAAAVTSAPVKRKSKKVEPLVAVEGTPVVDTTPAIVASSEPEVAEEAAAPEAEKKKKGLFGKKNR